MKTKKWRETIIVIITLIILSYILFTLYNGTNKLSCLGLKNSTARTEVQTTGITPDAVAVPDLDCCYQSDGSQTSADGTDGNTANAEEGAYLTLPFFNIKIKIPFKLS